MRSLLNATLYGRNVVETFDILRCKFELAISHFTTLSVRASP
jgi:hypothetical protein